MRLLLILAILIPKLSTAQPENGTYRIEYFARAPFYESPLHPTMFAHQITEEQAATQVHIKVDYDEFGRVIQVALRVGNYLKDLDGGFFGMNIHSPVTRISYHDKTEVHHFFDRFGNQISVMGDVHSKVYKKDQYGRNITLTYHDKSQNSAINFAGITSYNWTYQPDGSVIEIRQNPSGEIIPLRGAFQFLKTKMVYGPNGYFSMLQNIDDDGNLVGSESGAAAYKYYFDEQNRFLRWEVFDRDLKPTLGPSNTAGEINTYEGRNLTSIDFFGTDYTSPSVHWSGSEQIRMTYDQFGNKITSESRNVKGELMINNSGYAYSKQDWSEDGRFLLAVKYYDTNGNLVPNKRSGHCHVEYIRAENGVLVEKRHYNADGLKGHKKTGVAIIQYKYNSNNEMVQEIYLDKNKSVIKS